MVICNKRMTKVFTCKHHNRKFFARNWELVYYLTDFKTYFSWNSVLFLMLNCGWKSVLFLMLNCGTTYFLLKQYCHFLFANVSILPIAFMCIHPFLVNRGRPESSRIPKSDPYVHNKRELSHNAQCLDSMVSHHLSITNEYF